MAKSIPQIPKSLARCSRKFTTWRRNRTSRRIPNPMWSRAVSMARRFGVHRTARALGLNYAELKKRSIVRVDQEETTKSLPKLPSFVEMLPVGSDAVECVVDFERCDGGKMRVQLKGANHPDLEGLSRVFWGARA